MESAPTPTQMLIIWIHSLYITTSRHRKDVRATCHLGREYTSGFPSQGIGYADFDVSFGVSLNK